MVHNLPTQSRQISIGLRILQGNFDRGFGAELGIWQGDAFQPKLPRLELPAAPQIINSYQDWRSAYRILGGIGRMCPLQPVDTQITSDYLESRTQLQECKRLSGIFKQNLQHWFKQPAFRSIRDWISSILSQQQSLPGEAIPIFLEIGGVRENDREILYSLPWHLWNSYFEVVIQAPSFANRELLGHQTTPLLTFPKILAVFGSNKGGLRLQDDRETLNRVREHCHSIDSIPIAIDATPTANDPVLTPQLLVNKLYDSGCQILFFAGHSESDRELTDGSLELNDTQTISIDDLHSPISDAIRQGLTLAIFNSCDGLGIANALIQMGVPYVIVMRERIPDDAARQFFVDFLGSFLNGYPLYLAVKRARGRLTGTEFGGVPLPCVSWLPVTYQHPSQPDLIWDNSSLSSPTRPPVEPSWRQKFDRWRRQNQRLVMILLGILSAIIAILAGYFILPILIELGKPIAPVSVSAKEEGNISEGEQALIIKDDPSRARATGISRYRSGHYDEAIEQFKVVLKDPKTRNDPEILIYFNNAIAEFGKQKNGAEVITLGTSVLTRREEEILRGVSQAQTEFNCGSIERFLLAVKQQDASETSKTCSGNDGKLIKFLIGQYADKSNEVSRVAESLVKDPTVLAVVGRYISSNIGSVNSIFSEKKKILIAPTSNAVRKSKQKPDGLELDPNYIFRVAPDTSFIANQLVTYVKPKIGDKKFLILRSSDDPFANSLKQEVERIGSITIDGESPCDLSTKKSNFNGQDCLSSLQNIQVGSILLIPEVDDVSVEYALQFLKVFQEHSTDNTVILLGADTLYNKLTLNSEPDKNYGAVSQRSGILIAVPWARSENGETTFEINVKSLFGTSLINWRTAMSYDATKVIIKGLETANSSKSLQARLVDPNFEVTDGTATGTIKFGTGSPTSQGDRIPESNLSIFVKVVQDSDPSTFNFRQTKP